MERKHNKLGNNTKKCCNDCPNRSDTLSKPTKRSVMDILVNIGVFILVLCIIVGVTLVVVSKLSPSYLCENICQSYNGTYWVMSDCEGNNTMACAGYCVVPNGSTIFCEHILDNITSMG